MFDRWNGRTLVGWGVLVLFVTVGSLTSATQCLAGEEVTIDGVVHVRNGAIPRDGGKRLEVEELWRIGGEDDEENLLGVIVQALPDKEGNIYLLDMQLANVQVFSPEGEQLRSLSRSGEGPGEVTRPIDMCFLPSGNLGIVQMFPGKLVRLDSEGIPAGDVTLGGSDPTTGGFKVILDSKCRAGNLVLSGLSISQGTASQERASFLASFNELGEEQVRYLSKSAKLDFQNMEIIEEDNYFVYPRRWVLGQQGEVYAAPERNKYVIHVFAKDGTLIRVIEREFENRKRTEEELKRIRETMKAQTTRMPGKVHTEISETEPVISSMSIGPDGSLWVNHNSSGIDQPEGTLITYDVFDPKGHFTHQLSIACDGDGSDDGFFMIGDDRAVLVKGLVSGVTAFQAGLLGGGGNDEEEEEAPMEVICYKVHE